MAVLGTKTSRFTVPRLIFTALAAPLLLVLSLIIGANLVVNLSGADIYKDIDDAQEAQAAIILGAKVREDGNLSPILKDRVDKGIDLYKAGKVSKLLISGNHKRTAYDEVNAMTNHAIEEGVPHRDIFTDHAGFSTYESLYRARKIFRVKSAIIVSQRFHLRRVIFVARSLGLDAQVVAADRHPYSAEWRSHLRESLANVKAVWETAVDVRPTHLGPPVPITGDGRNSRS